MGSFLSKPVIAMACLCVILAFNGFILFRQNNQTTVTPNNPNNDVAKETLVTDNEYILASNSSFDYENLDQ
jgi:hypothetical protein